MSAAERKIVHVRLHDRDDVSTSSEGAEPNRYVVVSPAAERADDSIRVSSAGSRARRRPRA